MHWRFTRVVGRTQACSGARWLSCGDWRCWESSVLTLTTANNCGSNTHTSLRRRRRVPCVEKRMFPFIGRQWHIYFLNLCLNSFDFDGNFPAQDCDGAETLCFLVHVRGECSYAELTGSSAKTRRCAANNATRWLKIQPPTCSFPPWTMSAVWRFRWNCTGEAAQKTIDSSQEAVGVISCYISMRPHSVAPTSPIAVWAQINDTSEAPLDATAVQWLVFNHSCVPATIFSV